MIVRMIPFEAEAKLDWLALTRALEVGHKLPKAEIGDTFLYRGKDTLLNRAAWIDGLGLLVKSATIFPGNAEAGKPNVNGGACVYSDADGTLEAVVDFHLLTKWKTAGDSLLGALKLSRPDSHRILIVGAGTVAGSLREAYGAAFPDATFEIWNRTGAKAEAIAKAYPGTAAVPDLAEAVARADIVTVATMSTTPVIQGDWLRPGTHLDLIGAYRPDMREADDAAITAGRLFVDSRDSTIAHIGEIKDPVARGILSEGDIEADFYDLASGTFARGGDDEITVFKNGGGAHLDLMTARYILGAAGA